MAFGPYLILLATHGLRPYPAIIGVCGILHLTNPRPIPLFWAWEVHFVFQGPLAPLTITREFGPTPLMSRSLGYLGPLRSMGPLGPFWPKSNEAKRGPGGSPPAPKARWVQNHKGAHLSPILAPNLNNPKMAKRTPRTTGWPLETTRGHQLSYREASPQLRVRPLFHQCTLYQSIQVWCIYGIIYHYAPFLLSNTMGMFSGPKYVFSIQVPKSSTHFKGRPSSNSVLKSLVATRRPFKDPNHLALQELVGYFISGLFKG
ncbi:hypothetical protein O181_051850 [Austropuccinia psidii MF-1]|uniref:Uncharacterized protein n=1 Tax=Austropuccinia psidii MF-1 TaxID=1389203 RepID=A0A9Q3E3T3_9BASI|nr:hypothetical protein [Austropuccinia psidii MF-1]